VRIENRAARFNYDLQETFEAGIDLLGPEVKSVREGKISLNEAFIHLRDHEAFLINAHIHPYQPAGEKTGETSLRPTRPRKLLLHKKEIISLAGRVAAGLTLVPVALYNKGNIFKLEIALARGKKKWDKRRELRKRAEQREVEQTLRDKQ
jgi:SsrA-binding protein